MCISRCIPEVTDEQRAKLQTPLRTVRDRAHSHLIAAAVVNLFAHNDGARKLLGLSENAKRLEGNFTFEFAGIMFGSRFTRIDRHWWRVDAWSEDAAAYAYLEKNGARPWTIRNFDDHVSGLKLKGSKGAVAKLAEAMVALPDTVRYARPLGGEVYGLLPLPDPSVSHFLLAEDARPEVLALP